MVPSDLANDHMMGRIKPVKETPYTPDEEGNVAKMDSCCVVIENYDERGFMTNETEQNMDGKITEEGKIERIETGEFKSYTATCDGREQFKREIIRNGDEGKALDTDSTGQVTRVHILGEMNENRQAVKGSSYLADGKTYLGTWTYDYTDGLRTGASWTDSTGVLLMKRSGEVNNKGWIAKMVVMNINEEGEEVKVTETYTYDSFDDNGNWTSRTK